MIYDTSLKASLQAVRDLKLPAIVALKSATAMAARGQETSWAQAVATKQIP